MINQDHILEFSKKLKSILESELECGNLVVETSSGWPKSNSIMIILEKPFTKDHTIENIQFRNIDDRRYWKFEYFDEENSHILACRF